MTYHDQHAALVAYLKAKVEARDWHGVSDAACDLRVLEASDWKWTPKAVEPGSVTWVDSKCQPA